MGTNKGSSISNFAKDKIGKRQNVEGQEAKERKADLF
jgi:hypothetical protein